jgi:hypothetical protein
MGHEDSYKEGLTATKVSLFLLKVTSSIGLDHSGEASGSSSTQKNLSKLHSRKTITVKNAVFWDVTPRGSCKNGRLEGMQSINQQSEKSPRARNNISSN